MNFKHFFTYDDRIPILDVFRFYLNSDLDLKKELIRNNKEQLSIIKKLAYRVAQLENIWIKTMIHDSRSGNVIIKDDAIKIIKISLSDRECFFTHVNNLTDEEKKEYEKHGFILKR